MKEKGQPLNTSHPPRRTVDVNMFRGAEHQIVVKDGGVIVDGIEVVKADIVGSGGTIETIDTVLLQKESAAR